MVKEDKDYSRKRRARRKAVGGCVRCPAKAAEGRTMCLDCAQKFAAYLRGRRDARIAEGRCARCGGERDQGGRLLCDRCADINNDHNKDYQRRKREAGKE